MTVEEMELRFYELKGKLDVGAITEEQFRVEIERLRFQDAEGRWWMIGAQSGRWYVYDGARWIPSQPPGQAPAPPPAPPAPERPRPLPPPVLPTARTEPQDQTPLEIPHAQIAVPVAPRPVRRQPVKLAGAPRRSGFSLPLLAGFAALAGLVLVILLAVAVEQLVPGKPLSRLAGRLVGGNSSPSVATSAIVGQPVSAVSDTSLLMATGDRFLLGSQFDTAVAQYQAAAGITPSDPAPLAHWARALAFRGQTGEALAKAQQAVQRGPNDAAAEVELTRALAWSGQFAQAVTAGEKAVQLDAKNVNAHAALAEAYRLAQRPTDAQSHAQAALQLAPSSAEAHRALAWVLTLAGQKDAALAEWKQTVALEPNLSFRHFEYAEVLRLYFNAPAEAVSEYRQAIALYGAYIPAYHRLGLALLDVNQPEEAARQLQHALTLDPSNPEEAALLGVAFQRADQCAQAIPYFEQALQADADNAIAQAGVSGCQSGLNPTGPVSRAPAGPLVPPTVVPAAPPRGPATPAKP